MHKKHLKILRFCFKHTQHEAQSYGFFLNRTAILNLEIPVTITFLEGFY